jgi:hypothetical protein
MAPGFLPLKTKEAHRLPWFFKGGLNLESLDISMWMQHVSNFIKHFSNEKSSKAQTQILKYTGYEMCLWKYYNKVRIELCYSLFF